jgi:hypothetical protein
MLRIRKARQVFCSSFSPEIESLRGFLDAYPLLTIGIVFLFGLIVGGLLSAWPSQFVVVSLLGGSGLAIVHGSTIGLPSYVSAGLTVPILAFASYGSLRFLRSVEQYPRTKPYLLRIKRRYDPLSKYLLARASAIGMTGVLASSTFLIGWWVTVVLAFFLNVKVSTSMKGVGLGLGVGAFVSWASYQGLLGSVPNPIIITAITLIVSSAITKIIFHRAQQSAKM